MGQRGVGFSYQMKSGYGSLYLHHIGCDATFGDAVAVYANAALSDFRFSILFPVGSTAKQKIISRIGRCEVPDRYQFLRFRYPLGPHKNGAWMIVEDGRQYKVDSLSPEQVSFILAFAVNDTTLAELFHKGWVEGEPFPLMTGPPN